MYIQAASEYLWIMTGRRLGPSCPVTVRPCRKKCADEFGIGRFLNQGQYQSTGNWIPYLGADGEFRNASLCGCARDCHCGPELCEIELEGPVYDVTAVTIDGVAVDATSYYVADGRFLTRYSDGDLNPCWPACQDMTARNGSVGSFVVTYRTGLQLPVMAVLAAGALASHMMAECGDSCGCGTRPNNLKSLSRQGVDLEFVDAAEVFTDGRTGIPAVDRFIAAYGSPVGLRSPLRVLSPDHRPARTGRF
jgi:hypothetical protein